MEEWRSGGVEEWRSGGVEEGRSGGVEEWRSGYCDTRPRPSPTALFNGTPYPRLPTIAPCNRVPTNPEIGYITRYRLQFLFV